MWRVFAGILNKILSNITVQNTTAVHFKKKILHAKMQRHTLRRFEPTRVVRYS